METIMSKTNDTSREELTINKLDTVSGGDVLLSNVSKTRSEISMTFARNSRA
jgi:bacteriocin-like protein